MEQSKSKIRVAIELKNGDTHRVECSTIEYNAYGVELYGVKNYVCFGYEDISLMSIYIENEQTQDHITFRTMFEPKVERE